MHIIILYILLGLSLACMFALVCWRVKSLFTEGGITGLKNYIKQYNFNSLTSAFNFITILIMLLSVSLTNESIKNTLNISTKQLKQSEELFELQNRPIISIRQLKWYPMVALSGDIGLKIKIAIANYAKSPTSEAKIVKDVVMRIKMDTVKRFPNFVEDLKNITKPLDPNKEKRIVEEYIPHRTKPFNDISEYIFKKKGNVTGEDIIKHFSEEYNKKGYQFIPYLDLTYRSSLIIPPGDLFLKTGRSVSVSGFENDILEPGGDILLFYYAIEYTGPTKATKYIIHNVGCYDSFLGVKEKDEEGMYLFSYQKSMLEEDKAF